MTDILVQIADVHFGTEHKMAINAAIAAVKAIEPDSIILCGDLTQRGKRVEFISSKEWLDNFDAPKLVVPGNHDTPLMNMWTRMRSPFARYADYFHEVSQPIALPQGMCVGLNTARGWQARRNWAEGSVNLSDLDAQLKIFKAHNVKPYILACHHPFLSPPKAPMITVTRRGILASKRIIDAGVELLLTGHVHTPSATVHRDKNGSYLAVSAGTLSTRLRDYPPSFNVLYIDKGHIEVVIHIFNGTGFDQKTLGRWERNSLEPLS